MILPKWTTPVRPLFLFTSLFMMSVVVAPLDLRAQSDTYTFTTIAGSAGAAGTADGVGVAARFFNPSGIAIDNSGTLYVVDEGNHTIRKVTSSGAVTTFAGQPGTIGSADGAGLAATFNRPIGIAVDSAGNAYVADTNNHTIRRITVAGIVSTIAGRARIRGSANGPGANALFDFPTGIAVDSGGNVYVAERANQTIRKITPAGVVTTVAGQFRVQGSADGQGTNAQFDLPLGVAVDAAGTLYVADHDNNTVRKITAGGFVTTLAGAPTVSGSANGVGSNARFFFPSDVAVDLTGSVFVADIGNRLIRKIDSAGTVSTIGGSLNQSGSADGVGTNARFNYPAGVAVAGDGTLYVTDYNTNTIRKGVLNAGSSPNPGRLINLSVLTDIATAGDDFTLGYVVGGGGTTGAKPLVIRAAGPSLGAFGVLGTLDDPKLELFAGTTKTGENDNWGGSAQLAAALSAVGAFAFNAPTSRDAALTASITTRDNSVKVSAVGSGIGKVIAEIYDATPAASFTAATPRLVNVSVRKHLGSGLTVGFVIGGATPAKILVRAIGPTLGVFGVPGIVADPQLALFNSSSVKIGENNDWSGTAELTAAFAAVGAFALPATAKDAALLVRLPPGQYSAQVSGVSNTTGVALGEVYEVP